MFGIKSLPFSRAFVVCLSLRFLASAFLLAISSRNFWFGIVVSPSSKLSYQFSCVFLNRRKSSDSRFRLIPLHYEIFMVPALSRPARRFSELFYSISFEALCQVLFFTFFRRPFEPRAPSETACLYYHLSGPLSTAFFLFFMPFSELADSRLLP